jgi:hypothetical protein
MLRAYRNRRQSSIRSRALFEYKHFSFSLDLIGPGRAHVLFRFSVEEIQRLSPLLHLQEMPLRQRLIAELDLILAVLLARLSFPGRWAPLCDIFRRSQSWLSTVFNDTVVFLAGRFARMLQWHPQLTYTRLEAMATAVEAQGGGPGIWGFVDGTFRGFCRPQGQDNQRRVYCGHKRAHGVNWQAIVTPDGLVVSLVGPFPGPTNDWTMWRVSGCEEALRQLCIGRQILRVYGDPAYANTFGTLCPFEHPQGRHWLPPNEREYNARLLSVRIAVENAFGHTQQLWTYTAFSKGLKAG